MSIKSVKSIKGRRDYMEDRYALARNGNATVCIVCDGHGGYETAEQTVKNLPAMLLKECSYAKNNIEYAQKIRRVIMDWGNKMRREKAGSTLTGILVTATTVFVFNIGDSRTYIQLTPNSYTYKLINVFNSTGEFVDRTVVDYTQNQFFKTIDHDPGNNFERVRVKAAGGTIRDQRLDGILAVTRALGDADIFALSHVPDVFWIAKEYIAGPAVLVSDGVYELQKSTQANVDRYSDKFLYYLATNFSADVLVNYTFENGSDDNITAVVFQI